MVNKKKQEWSLKRHRKQSPQLDKEIKHHHKLWSLGILISFFLGIVAQAFLFPAIFDKKPQLEISIQNTSNKYILKIKNAGIPVQDLSFEQLFPGLLININKTIINTDCRYRIGKIGVEKNNQSFYLKGQESILVFCNRLGSDGVYTISFDLDTENYQNIIYSGGIKTPEFLTIGCKYFTLGSNNRIRKQKCFIDNSIDAEEFASEHGLKYTPPP